MTALPAAFASQLPQELAARLLLYPGNPSALSRLCDYFLAQPHRRPIALVGAGASAPLPGWQALLSSLGQLAVDRGTATQLEIDVLLRTAIDDPLKAAGELFRLFGDRRLALAEIRRIFTLPDGQPLQLHRAILKLPLKGLTTTNYDLGLAYAWREEHSFDEAGVSVGTHAMQDTVKQWLDRSIFDSFTSPILHLHGSIDQPAGMILDDESYSNLYGRRKQPNPYVRLIEDLWLHNTLLLIGFSGNDPLLRKLAKETLSGFQWAGTTPQHIAILPLEPDRRSLVPTIRKEFYRDFRADVVFFDPSSRTPAGRRFEDLSDLILALARAFPNSSELLRREKLSTDEQVFKRAVISRTRNYLQERIPRAKLVDSTTRTQDTVWIPRIRPAASEEQTGPLSVDVTTICAGPGAGKSVLSRLLALSLIENDSDSQLVRALPQWITDRRLPLLIDLKRFANDLLIGPEKPSEAIRRIIISAWGQSAQILLDGQVFHAKGILILDALEALLWSSRSIFGATDNPVVDADDVCRKVLVELLKYFSDVPVVILARPFAGDWLRNRGVLLSRRFELEPLTSDDIKAISESHVAGAILNGGGAPNVGHGLGSVAAPALTRIATTPMLVKLAAQSRTDALPNSHLTAHRMISGFFDHVLHRGLLDEDEAPPLPNATLRDLARLLAFRIAEKGSTGLTRAEVLDCGTTFSIDAEEALLACKWLESRTDLVAVDADGGLSFSHDWYQETLAAEWISQRFSAEEMISVAESQRLHETMKYAISFSNSYVASKVVEGLLSVGRTRLALGALDWAWDKLTPRDKQHLEPTLLGARSDESTDCVLMADFAARHDEPLTDTLILKWTLPIQCLRTEDAIEAHKTLSYDDSEEFADWLRGFARLAANANTLTIDSSRIDEAILALRFSNDVDSPSGGVWSSASIICRTIDGGLSNLTAFVELFQSIVSNTSPGTLSRLAQCAAKAASDHPQQALAAVALCVERLQSNARTEFIPSEAERLIDIVELLPVSESPAFQLGLCNSLFDLLSRSRKASLRRRVLALRSRTLDSLSEHLGSCDWIWRPEASRPPRATLLAMARDALSREATSPPKLARSKSSRRRNLLDRYIASSGHLIHKLKAKDTTGRWAYYFVLVTTGHEQRFLKAIEGDGTINLEDYGKVVASCYGEEPNAELKDYLLEKYGFHV